MYCPMSSTRTFFRGVAGPVVSVVVMFIGDDVIAFTYS
jgi:hypothetical protein